ncbi:MAG: hypothetical protein UU98_C0018G0005 [Parcubacteria group bacterium GW2011_GWD2_42_14]|nr:MAG: hypothetical protein UU98_C0018G0005 [Parcubacteria group bacterium GW2011_GWD2_42_14]
MYHVGYTILGSRLYSVVKGLKTTSLGSGNKYTYSTQEVNPVPVQARYKASPVVN